MSYEKSEETRRKLTQTMSHLLRTQGFYATPIQQVLKESGIPKGSLYYHFPKGKVELAAGSVEKSADAIVELMGEINRKARDPMDSLQTFCDFYIEELNREDFTMGCPIATITLEAAATNDVIQRACQSSFERFNTIFIDTLRQYGIDHTTAAEMAIISLSSIEGALMLCKAQRSTRPLELVRDNLVRQIAELLPSK